MTPDTLFQIGSITKLYTTTLLLQAQAAGVLALDEPVRAQLQEFSVADPGATIEITPRHLVTHTSGIEGDHLTDTGWNEDALQRYVATLAALGQIHPTDEAYSFCNTGFGVAGRLLEVATGEHFDRVLRRRLTRPLGCAATVTLPQHALLHRVAAGHVQKAGHEAKRQSRWALTRSNGPMGGVMAPAAELLAFARVHVDEGRAADGSDLLPPASVEEMQRPQVESPFPGEEQALGWTIRRWGDLTCLGQDADTMGQRASLRIVPEADFAVCVLTNSPTGAAVIGELIPRVVADLLEVDARVGTPAAGIAASDPARYVGRYERLHQHVEVTEGPDGLVATTEPSGVLGKLGVSPATIALDPFDPETGAFRGVDPLTGATLFVVFSGEREGAARSLHLEGRLHRRTG
jgi:CubicO group peptidase (beta-lactamase class C family)